NDLMDPLFTGVVQATEEAVVNALVDNHSMTGRDNHRVEALPHNRLREIMKRFRRGRSILSATGSARVSPKQALPLKVGAQGGCEFPRKVRDREDALANTRDPCATQ